MANQIAKTKQQISLTLPRDMIKRLDALAVERGTSRAALITDAVAAPPGSTRSRRRSSPSPP